MTTLCSGRANFLHATSDWCRAHCHCIPPASVYCAGCTSIRTLALPLRSLNAGGLCCPMAGRNDLSFCADRHSTCLNSPTPRRKMGSLDVCINLPHTFNSSNYDGCSLPRCSRSAPTRLPYIHASSDCRAHRADAVSVRQTQVKPTEWVSEAGLEEAASLLRQASANSRRSWS